MNDKCRVYQRNSPNRTSKWKSNLERGWQGSIVLIRVELIVDSVGGQQPEIELVSFRPDEDKSVESLTDANILSNPKIAFSEAKVADQMVENWTWFPKVAGSNPTESWTISHNFFPLKIDSKLWVNLLYSLRYIISFWIGEKQNANNRKL